MGSARALIRESAFIRVLIRQAPPVAQCLEFSEPVQKFFRSFSVPARDANPSGGRATPLQEFERFIHHGHPESTEMHGRARDASVKSPCPPVSVVKQDALTESQLRSSLACPGAAQPKG